MRISRRFATLTLIAALAGTLFAQGGVAAGAKTLVVLGDSLAAGLGLPQSEAFPEKLAIALQQRGIDANVVNAGVSGDTSAGALERLEWSVPADAAAVIVELGANDALRGLDPAATRANLNAIIARLKGRGLAVLLAGMLAPPNMGQDYAEEFRAIYPELASRHGVPFYPFFLDGVAAIASLNQADGIHPTAAGVDIIVERMLPHVEQLLQKAAN